MEDTTFRAKDVNRILGGVRLHLIQPVGYSAIGVLNESGGAGGTGDGFLARAWTRVGWEVSESQADLRLEEFERTPNPPAAFARQGTIP